MSQNIPTIEELSKLLDKLQSKKDRLRDQLSAIERDVDSVSNTLRLMGQTTPTLPSVDLSGKTQLDALVAIAKANNNRLVVRTARRLMSRAGFFKGSKHASSILFTTINRSGKFEREAPGTYRLIEQKLERREESGSLIEDVSVCS